MRDIGNGGRGIALNHHEVGLLAHRNGADAIRPAEVRRPVQRADLDRLQRRQTALNEQLSLTLVGVAGDHAAGPRRVRARQEQPAGVKERHLHCAIQREQLAERRRRVLLHPRVLLIELRFENGIEHVEPGGHRLPGCDGLEHGLRRRDRDVMSDQVLHE